MDSPRRESDAASTKEPCASTSAETCRPKARSRIRRLARNHHGGPAESASAVEPLGSITEFSAGLNPGSTPQGIIAGSDGNLWFADNAFSGTPAIGRINPSTQAITEFSAGLNAGSSPFGIAAGSDGNLWFADQGTTGAIGRATPAGTITEFSAGLNPGSGPFWIVAGPDGNLWFTDRGSTRAIGRIDPDTQAITEFSAGLTPGAGMIGIAAGPDGALWFPERNDPPALPAIGRASTAGASTEFSNGLNPGSGPRLITAGPDGNMWFTDNGDTTAAIGRIGTAPPPSSSFAFGKLRRNKRRGTATLTVEVPGPGTLALSGRGLVQESASAASVRRAADKVVSAASQGPAQGRPQGEEEAGAQPQRQGEGERQDHLHADRRQPEHTVEADQADQEGLAGCQSATHDPFQFSTGEFTVNCTSLGQLCEPPFQQTVQVPSGGRVTSVMYTAPPGHCSPVRIQVLLDGSEIGATDFVDPNKSSELACSAIQYARARLSSATEPRAG